MSVRLTVKHRSDGGAQELLLDAPVITLGREKSCEVVLGESAVSRNHARISQDGALCFLEDLGSAYGTQLNGQKLPSGEKRLLRNGDVIAIAQFDVTFDRVTGAASADEKTSFVARQLVKDVMKGVRAGESPFLRVMNGPDEGKRLELTDAQELVIGRDPAMAGYVLKDDDLVSRRHAKVRRDWSGTHVEDLGSRNGIKVNKRKVPRRTLRDKDELQVGATRFLFLDPTEVREDAPPLEALVPEDEGGNTLPPAEPEVPAAVVAPPVIEPASAPEPAVADAEEEPPAPAFEAARPPVEELPEPGTDRNRMVVVGVVGVVGALALVLLLLVLVGA